MKKSDFLLQIVTVTLSVTHLSATKLKWDPYFNQNRIEELIDTPEKAVSVVLENGRLNQVPPDRVVKWSFLGKFSIKDGLDPSSIAWGTFTDSLNITGMDHP